MFPAMFRILVAGLGLLGALLLGSGQARAIVGGAGIDPNTVDSPWAGVGSVTVRNGGVYSGALIGRRHVLTAAHAVAGVRNPRADISFNLNYGGTLSHHFRARAIHILPAFQGARPGPDGIWFGDMAIIELSEDVPEGVPVYPLYGQPSLGLPRDSTLTLVGYGAHGDGFGELAADGNPGVKHVGQNRLDVLIGRKDSRVPEVFMFGFDAPAAEAFKPAPAAGRPLAAEAGFAGGDSGSPVFILHDNVWKILGIATFNAGTPRSSGNNVKFGAIEGGTFVAPHTDWIESVLNTRPEDRPDAGESPRPDAPSSPLPETGLAASMLAGIGLLLWIARRKARRR